jgi:folate-binding protein YgfZ
MLDVIRLFVARFNSLRHDPGLVLNESAVFRVEGLGAVDCLQGIFTCDVSAPGPWSLQYGAMLTPKGMIVADFHILRDATGFTLVTSLDARQAALELFRKQLPPRLARLTDRSDSDRTIWLLGQRSQEVLGAAGLPWPGEPGRSTVLPPDATTGPLLGRPHPLAPWPGIITGGSAECTAIANALEAAGSRRSGEDDLDAARILAGWPRLGREIDARTLPQEVRFDDTGGVSYTKGCYVGQETVARVHFRGHVNRMLRGLAWEGAPPEQAEIAAGSKVVGRITSMMQVEERGYGLAILRREVEPGAEVTMGNTTGTVERLPFPVPAVAA